MRCALLIVSTIFASHYVRAQQEDLAAAECVSEQNAAGELGFTQVTWDGEKKERPASYYKYWGNLTDCEKAAAVTLGYNAKTWNDESGSEPKPASASKGWDQLTTCDCVSEQKAAGKLGFTQAMWDKISPKETQPDSIKKYWDNLTGCEKAAAVILGYNATTWNNVSGSESKPASASKGWDQLTTCDPRKTPVSTRAIVSAELTTPELGAKVSTTTTTTQEVVCSAAIPYDEKKKRVFLNEISAGNNRDNVREGVEVVGPANVDLAGWSVQNLLVIPLHSGQVTMEVKKEDLNLESPAQEEREDGIYFLEGKLDDQSNGFGAKWFDIRMKYDAYASADSVLVLWDPDGINRDVVSYSGPTFRAYLGDNYPRTYGNLTGQRTGEGCVPKAFPWATVLRPASRGRINDNQTFPPEFIGDDSIHWIVIPVLGMVMTIAVLTIVGSLIIGVMFRSAKTKTERPLRIVAVPKQTRIDKFLSDRAMSDRSLSFARRRSQEQSALARDPRYQLSPEFLTEVKRNLRADYGVDLTEHIGVPRDLQKRTLENSNFRAIYKSVMQAGVPTRPAQLLLAAEKLIKLYAEIYLSTNPQNLEKFLSKLNTEAFGNKCHHKHEAIGCFAELMWTSTNTLAGKEFSNILNLAIREDRPEFLVHAMPLVCGINRLRRIKRDSRSYVDKAFPPNGVSWRGTSFREEFKPFYTVGVRFRIPAFYATSFSQKIARQFALRAPGNHFRAIWRVQVDPRGAKDPIYRTKHAAYVRNTFVKGEGEYLFAPYSVFTVERVCWSTQLEDPHVLHLTAALDNSRESDTLALAPWY